MRARDKTSWLLGLALLAGCMGDTGGEVVELPLFVRGASAEPFMAGEWRVELTRADVAFGPAYFCATASADQELCEVAVAESRDTTTIDGLDPTRRRAGELHATTGSVRSSLFDYGIAWLLPDQRPSARPGAPGGHSAVLEGEAEHDGQRVQFVLRVDLSPIAPGDATVNGRRTQHEIRDAHSQLTAAIEPARWVSGIDFDAWLADSDDASRLRAAPGDAPYETVVLGMTVNAPVAFDWRRSSGETP